MLTAGHCTCALREKDPNKQPQPHKNSLCKPQDQNQITPSFNTVDVYGGHMNTDRLKSADNAENTFTISYAYIKDIDLSAVDPFRKSDLAILISDKLLFDEEKLKDYGPLDRPSMLPICLAAKGTNFDNLKILGVGWGKMYDEIPENDPYYSSCMTDEVGPEKWRFEHCELQELNADGSCEKKSRPREVKENKEICEEAFHEATRLSEGTQIGSMDMVDKILIYSEDPNEPQLICYNERNFREKGWCNVLNHVTGEYGQWGFCSPSCKDDSRQVQRNELSFRKIIGYTKKILEMLFL